MDFSAWLQEKMDEKQLSQSDLARSAGKAGFSISQNQLSRILSRRQQAGVEASIAIAHGLGLPREEIFRARGWLLSEPRIVTKVMPPKLAEVFQLVQGLAPAMQADLGHVFREMLLGMMRAHTGYEGEKQIEKEEPSANQLRLQALSRRIEGMEENLGGAMLERAIGMIESQVELLELTAKNK